MRKVLLLTLLTALVGTLAVAVALGQGARARRPHRGTEHADGATAGDAEGLVEDAGGIGDGAAVVVEDDVQRVSAWRRAFLGQPSSRPLGSAAETAGRGQPEIRGVSPRRGQLGAGARGAVLGVDGAGMNPCSASWSRR